jgi:peptide/nickel transport system substrate-binding protein
LQGSGTAPQQPEPPSGCLIATTAYGSELAPQVQYLRNFREQYILSTAAGSAFMNSFNSVYYSFSPQIADYEREQPWLQSTVKAALYPLFGALTISEKAHFAGGGGEVGAVLAGATAGSLIGLTYLLPIGIAATKRVPTRWILFAALAGFSFLFVSIVAAPFLLAFSTVAFVIVVTASAALLAAKLLHRVLRRTRSA